MTREARSWPARPFGRATPRGALPKGLAGRAGRPLGPTSTAGVGWMKAEVKNNKVLIEILPNVWLRLRDVKEVNKKCVVFRNPISGMTCIARLS